MKSSLDVMPYFWAKHTVVLLVNAAFTYEPQLVTAAINSPFVSPPLQKGTYNGSNSFSPVEDISCSMILGKKGTF